jgi:hypothetical protein
MRGTTVRYGDLEIETDLRLQRKFWVFERTAWAVMCLVLAAALAGATGRGPLSAARATDSGLTVEYDRFSRMGSDVSLVAHLDAAEVTSGRVQLWVSQNYLDHVEVRSITPQPSASSADGGHVMFTFDVAPNNGATVLLRLRLLGTVFGRVSGEAGTGSGRRVSFRQFVYP